MKLIIKLNDDFIKKNADINAYSPEELDAKGGFIKLVKCMAFNRILKYNKNEIILTQDNLTKLKNSTELFESAITKLFILAISSFDNENDIE